MTDNRKDRVWATTRGDLPLIATALHDGHVLREEAAALSALDESQRRREEDPGTGEWTRLTDTRIVAIRSRFEVDMNRPRSRAVYLQPEDAWGLTVWRERPENDFIERSLVEYDAFYAEVHAVLTEMEKRFGRFILLDLHAYNHRRQGPGGPPADAENNPDVDIETEPEQRQKWSPVITRLVNDLRNSDCVGRPTDVRENVRFTPGHFVCWVNAMFPRSACAIAIEFKKTYMDEWTGRIDSERHKAIACALNAAAPGLLEELRRL